MNNEKLELIPVHHHPEFFKECMSILNYQWPRSEALRIRSLQSSCDQLPTSLVLVKRDDSNFKVLGHSRIVTIPNKIDSLWFESVIIHQDFRGKGFGRTLMELTEKYVINLGYDKAVLSTHDQQPFYLKLGYEFCDPVCLYGGVVNKNLLPKLQFQNINTHCYNYTTDYNKSNNKCTNYNLPIETCKQASSTFIPPPPPPPPQFKSKLKKCDIKRIDTTKTFMRKLLLPSENVHKELS